MSRRLPPSPAKETSPIMVRYRRFAVALLVASSVSRRRPRPRGRAVPLPGRQDSPDGAELKYVNGLPVLTVGRQPERDRRRGRQPRPQAETHGFCPTRATCSRPTGSTRPGRCSSSAARACSSTSRPTTAPRWRPIARASGADPDVVMVANTFFDLKSTFECSALMVGGVAQRHRRRAVRPQPRLPVAGLHPRTHAGHGLPAGRQARLRLGRLPRPGRRPVRHERRGAVPGGAGGLRRQGRRAALRPARACPTRCATAGCWRNARPLRRRKSCWKGCPAPRC